HPRYSYAHRLLGICYYRKQDLKNAETEFKQALKDPEDIKARFFIAKIYLARERKEEAREVYDELRRMAPDSEEVKLLDQEFAESQKPEPEQKIAEPLDVETILKELTAITGIDGALLIESDGLLIAAENVNNSEEIAGLISGIANQCWLTGSDFSIGDVESFSITMDNQNLISIIGPDAILTVTTKAKSAEGLATLYSARFHNRIKDLLRE
ncbi:MAG TPA: tetratricopeptide repeat protein, partial [bacterium (Candidatus Stahlbacteria)]|nr:tetratricopeptide repeat protein [Candidatus Stahlbacteria bacterium]